MKKLVLITGIDNSISRQTCKKFLQEDFDVIVTYNNNYTPGSKERLEFESEIKDFSPIQFEQVDLQNKESINTLIGKLKKHEFDVIVNCASTLAFTNKGELRHEFIDFDYDNFVEVIQYNIAAVAAISVGLKNSIKSGGSIVNITSSAADEGAFATISYNASKSAVKNLTKSLANNFGGLNVRVNSVAPGWIPASKDVAATGIVALANSITPAKENGSPENVAEAVFSIVNNSFINGASIDVTGGITSSYWMYELESLQLQNKLTDDELQPIIDFNEKMKKKLSN
jgi:3-oxoacyl-[acyl-carrier protein] reductase